MGQCGQALLGLRAGQALEDEFDLLLSAGGGLAQAVAFGFDLDQAALQGIGTDLMITRLGFQGSPMLTGFVACGLEFLVVARKPLGHAGEFLAFAQLLVFQGLAFLFELPDLGLQGGAFGLKIPRKLSDLADALGQGVEVLEHAVKPLGVPARCATKGIESYLFRP